MADDHDPQSHQFHFDPATYLTMVRAEVPAYDELQAVVARSAAAVPSARVLDSPVVRWCSCSVPS
ncbi:MAG: hypothetical protein ACR2JF_10715 [Iamia sp.]